ncbi:N-acetyl-anhydromuranmyl-L-alanine amidase [Nitrosomonas sp. PY1]|uniref:1,6-anhydro-N-acetylmuramyl-L-alanine amidase AmpD n=1 Tax=Nitrosomonas sp. PY1 TaxID=1803906 RepID=UPI001FC7E135|nr:1,6-anhydro-N-acetylmuramyl-L-alanine amidase AmpD [Nitrosomonas sp. PY1]GKS69391.1 N-acetyl-anhydromuranmyl-L-alanine amidase [Nitrosomonas sp. PY1]
MYIDADGLLNTAHFIFSPNYDDRPHGIDINLLVIHNISLPPNDFTGNGVIDLFTNQIDPQAHPYYQTLAGLKVSTHFFIRRTGAVIQFVSCNKRAWHAGISYWRKKERCNDFSIGIELEGSDTIAFTDNQYTQLIALTQCLYQRYPIQDIAGHCHIAPERKTDPGPYFEWQRYLSALRNDNKEFQ